VLQPSPFEFREFAGAISESLFTRFHLSGRNALSLHLLFEGLLHPPNSVVINAKPAKRLQVAAEGRLLVVNLSLGNQAKKQYLSERVASAIPSQPVTARASRQVIVRIVASAFATLKDMIRFPMAMHPRDPAHIFEDKSVTAKMTAAFGFIEDFT
jgi:hypothetical protein